MNSRRWPLYLVALAFAYAAKRWYSHASPESLTFILAPTARLVGALFHARFELVPGYGYLGRTLHFGIVPACAGINFLVMATGAFLCGVVPLLSGLGRRVRWIVVGAAACYVLTIVANTVRIAIAVWLQLHPVDVDPAQLHRIEGSVVYLGFLFGFYALAEAQARRHAS